jgi:hypothetical protein
MAAQSRAAFDGHRGLLGHTTNNVAEHSTLIEAPVREQRAT